MTKATALTVFDASASPCARRLKIVLKEKGLPFETVRLDLGRADQKNPRYLALNANGTVPTLVHDGFAIGETNAAIRYLDDVFPEKPLYPTDPVEAQLVEHWMAEELAMAKLYRPLIYQRVIGPFQRITGKPPSPGDWGKMVWELAVLEPAKEAHLEADLLVWLQRLDHALAQSPYLMGDTASLADFVVAPRTRMLPILVGKFEGRFDNVARWIAALDERPSFVDTLIEAEAKLMKIGQTPLFPAARAMWGPGRKPSIKQRLLLKVATPVMRKLAKKASVPEPSFPDAKAAPATGAVRTMTAFPEKAGAIQLAAPSDDMVARGLVDAALAAGLNVTWKEAKHFSLRSEGEELAHHETACEFLARLVPEAQLLGVTPAEVARTRAWFALAQSLQKEARLLLSDGPYPVSRAASLAEAERLMAHFLAEMADGKFLSGSHPGVADHVWAQLVAGLSSAGIGKAAPETWSNALATVQPKDLKKSA